MNSTHELSEAEKKRIIIEEKSRMRDLVSDYRSREIDLIMAEESPLFRGREELRLAFEVLIGTIVGIAAPIIVILVAELFP